MGEENNSIACACIFLQVLTVHPYFLAQSLQAFLIGAQSLPKFYWAHQLPYTLEMLTVQSGRASQLWIPLPSTFFISLMHSL